MAIFRTRSPETPNSAPISFSDDWPAATRSTMARSRASTSVVPADDLSAIGRPYWWARSIHRPVNIYADRLSTTVTDKWKRTDLRDASGHSAQRAQRSVIVASTVGQRLAGAICTASILIMHSGD